MIESQSPTTDRQEKNMVAIQRGKRAELTVNCVPDGTQGDAHAVIRRAPYRGCGPGSDLQIPWEGQGSHRAFDVEAAAAVVNRSDECQLICSHQHRNRRVLSDDKAAFESHSAGRAGNGGGGAGVQSSTGGASDFGGAGGHGDGADAN
eukprot:COSAG02_NODE_12900_length_1474_cov_13.567273_3_plen_147_part_01